MKLEIKDYIGIGTLLISLSVGYFEHTGKISAKEDVNILIEQQNEIIKRYEKEAEHSAVIITFLDSIARTK